MEKQFDFTPKGVCASKMTFTIDGTKLVGYECEGGCPGNKLGIKKLIEGMAIDDVIEKLIDVECGKKGSSCPNQIACGLLEYQAKNGDGLPDRIDLYNRYGDEVALVKCGYCEFDLQLANNGLSCRIGSDPDTNGILFVDPSGGPMISVGSKLKNLINDFNGHDELNGFVVKEIIGSVAGGNIKVKVKKK